MRRRRFLQGAAAVLVLSGAMALTAQAGVISDSGTYTFSQSSETSYTKKTDYKGFTIIPHSDSSKLVKISSQLSFPGGGSRESSCLEFTPTSACDISVVFASTKDDVSDVRSLVIDDSSADDVVLTDTNALNKVTAKYSYTGSGGDPIYIYSKAKALYIYEIKITYKSQVIKGDVDGNGVVNEADAGLVLRHTAGSTLLSDTNKVLSAANANNDGSVDLLDAIWILANQTPEISGDAETVTVDTSDGVEVSDYAALSAALAKSGAKVYVTADIDCGDQLSLDKSNQSIIGVPKEDGTLPVLNFADMAGKRDIVNEGSSDGDVGIRIKSSNNTVENLVVEFAHDNGIQIKGTGALFNTVRNCVLRYNNDSGIQITGGAYGTTTENVYSYRNCDVYTLGGNADGFAVKLSAGPETVSSASEFRNKKNTFTNCFAWDNGDDGWDSFDYPEEQQSVPYKWTYKIDYTNCMCWANGSAALHVGYTDYAAGRTLDENLPVIRRIKVLAPDKYDSFVEKYNSGGLGSRSMSASSYYKAVDSLLGISIPTEKGGLTIAGFVSAWGGNPNGFKIGSAYTQKISERTFVNCIAFDHTAAGFDKNNSACSVELTNTISFKNGYNYHFSGCTAKAFENVYGWSVQKSDDLPTAASGVTVKVKTPSNTSQTEQLVRTAADKIAECAAGNKFTATNVFDTVFS